MTKYTKTKILRIKPEIEVTKNIITMRQVMKFFRTGKWMSCPELIQRLIDKNAWKFATVNNYFKKSHTFTGGGILQNIITTTRDNMIAELENQNLKTLDDDAEEEIPLPTVKKVILDKIIEYCTYVQTKPVPEIEKPIKSSNLADTVKD